MKCRVCIILVNYMAAEESISCIESLLKSSLQDFNVILIDNASNDGSLQTIGAWAAQHRYEYETVSENVLRQHRRLPKLLLVAANDNRGFAAGNNIGIRLALDTVRPEHIWLLNNDTEVLPGTLGALYHHISGTGMGIVGAKLFDFYERDVLQAVGGRFNPYLGTSFHVGEGEKDSGQFDKEAFDFDYVVGASMYFSTEVLDKVGLLNENLFLFYEEVDICNRARNQGFALGFCPNAIIYHKGGATIGNGKDTKSDLADYHGIRSKIIFMKEHYPKLKLFLYLSLSASVLLRLLKGKPTRAKDVIELALTL